MILMLLFVAFSHSAYVFSGLTQHQYMSRFHCSPKSVALLFRGARNFSVLFGVTALHGKFAHVICTASDNLLAK